MVYRSHSLPSSALEGFLSATESPIGKYENCTDNLTSVKLLTKFSVMNSFGKDRKIQFSVYPE